MDASEGPCCAQWQCLPLPMGRGTGSADTRRPYHKAMPQRQERTFNRRNFARAGRWWVDLVPLVSVCQLLLQGGCWVPVSGAQGRASREKMLW